MNPIDLMPGDIILVTKKKHTWIRDFLTWITRNKVRFTHVLAVFSLNPFTVIEAEERVRKVDVKRINKIIADENANYRVVRKNYHFDQMSKVIDIWEKELDQFYGVTTILWHLVSFIIRKRSLVSKLNRNPRAVCSSLVAKGYQNVYGTRFSNMDWWMVTPDDIDDETTISDEWSVVCERL